MHHWPTIRYEDLEPRLRTGDIVLFRGASLRSRIIEAATQSEFSHIGMIVRPQHDQPPLLWQTDPRAVTEDVVENGQHGGAQLNELTAALAAMTSPAYGDTPFIRQLVAEHASELDEQARLAIAALERTPFPSLAKLIREWLLGHLRIATSIKRMDCAETVALTYQQMGLLASDPPPNSYNPRDFSEQHMNLRLLRGATLGPQLEVVWSGSGAGQEHGPSG